MCCCCQDKVLIKYNFLYPGYDVKWSLELMFQRSPSMDNWMQLGRPEIDFWKVLHTASGDVGLDQCSGPSIFAPTVGPLVDSFMVFSTTFFLQSRQRIVPR